MAESEIRTTTLTVVSGLVVIVGGVVVLASVFWESVTLAATRIDVFLVGGAVFAVGILLGGVDRWVGGDLRRGAAQAVSAFGWAGFVWGTSDGPAVVLYAGLGLMLVGGLVLVGADEWLTGYR